MLEHYELFLYACIHIHVLVPPRFCDKSHTAYYVQYSTARSYQFRRYRWRGNLVDYLLAHSQKLSRFLDSLWSASSAYTIITKSRLAFNCVPTRNYALRPIIRRITHNIAG